MLFLYVKRRKHLDVKKVTTYNKDIEGCGIMSKRSIFLTDKSVIELHFHPKVHRILRLMKKSGEPMTVKMIADEMEMDHGNVFYYIKKLINADLIELVKTRKVNGITAKYYLRKYDQIFYEHPDQQYKEFKDLYSFNESVYNEVCLDFLEEVHPSITSYDNVDADREFIYHDFYNFDPNDIVDIAKEVYEIFQKYDKKTDTSNEYVTLLGVGKHRKKIFKFVDEIKNKK